jgi:tripartite-type tricarboxylate transporter receptor subunit TctC
MLRSMSMKRPDLFALLCGMLLVACLPAAAQDAASFYRGRTIHLVVGYSAGGGFDQYARALARHFGRHIPGEPAFAVENMPGAASLKAVQYLDHGAQADGTVITTFDPGLITRSLTVPDKLGGVRFTDYAWIGSISEDVRVCYVWAATGIDSFDRLKARNKETILGLAGVGTSSDVNARMLVEMFGVRLKMVQGYAGSAEKRIAIESGELESDCGSWTSVPEDWLRDRKVAMVLRFSENLVPGLDASVPYAADLLKDPAAKSVYRLLLDPNKLGRPFIAPKAVPADRLAVLRAGFDATMKDPAFLAEADKQKLLVSPMNGAQSEAAVRELAKASPASIAEAKRISGE